MAMDASDPRDVRSAISSGADAVAVEPEVSDGRVADGRGGLGPMPLGGHFGFLQPITPRGLMAIVTVFPRTSRSVLQSDKRSQPASLTGRPLLLHRPTGVSGFWAHMD